MKFEWDENKNSSNKIKHGVTFEEATTVFDDKYAIYLEDKIHSIDEDRFFIIGMDNIFRKLTVCHCYRDKDEELVRIISARKATKRESSLYEEGLV
ncbi:MAG: BrnT family toxin [Oscillospiraceae bacterium]|nr:BrnT family toxin [Oscillospiraceae bacterium]